MVAAIVASLALAGQACRRRAADPQGAEYRRRRGRTRDCEAAAPPSWLRLLDACATAKCDGWHSVLGSGRGQYRTSRLWPDCTDASTSTSIRSAMTPTMPDCAACSLAHQRRSRSPSSHASWRSNVSSSRPASRAAAAKSRSFSPSTEDVRADVIAADLSGDVCTRSPESSRRTTNLSSASLMTPQVANAPARCSRAPRPDRTPEPNRLTSATSRATSAATRQRRRPRPPRRVVARAARATKA